MINFLGLLWSEFFKCTQPRLVSYHGKIWVWTIGLMQGLPCSENSGVASRICLLRWTEKV